MVYKGIRKSEGKCVKYLYDIWVNWFEGEEQGYNVCHYHEWRKKDKLAVLEQIPIVHVKESFFHYVENSLNDLPPNLLEMIENHCYKRKGIDKENLRYAAIVTDGTGIIAFDTNGYQIAVKKSRLIPRQEQQVYKACQTMEQMDFEHTPLEKGEQENISLLSLSPKYMYGLTRRERQLKKILMIAMDHLQSSNDRNELLYWLSEWDNKKWLTYLHHENIKDIWQVLYDEVVVGWSEAHEALCLQMIKGNTFLENFWKQEQTDYNPSSKS